MHKYAMIGYYPIEVSGQVYAVGNEGVTVDEVKERAAVLLAGTKEAPASCLSETRASTARKNGRYSIVLTVDVTLSSSTLTIKRVGSSEQ